MAKQPFQFIPGSQLAVSYKEICNHVKEHGPTIIGQHVPTEYVLVYGTLRYGAGNWSCILNNNSHWVTPLKLKGFCKDWSLSCSFTGNEEHETVFDLFKLDLNDTETQYRLDRLEGTLGNRSQYTKYSYNNMFIEVPFTLMNEEGVLEEHSVVAKFYHVGGCTQNTVDYWHNDNEVITNLSKLVPSNALHNFKNIYNA